MAAIATTPLPLNTSHPVLVMSSGATVSSHTQLHMPANQGQVSAYPHGALPHEGPVSQLA